MTLIIQKPTGAKLNLAKTYVGTDDPDAAVYVAAVEAADGQSLETATKVAIHSFVKGCKNDGIWPAIKASCILAGARTLNGALVPLAGAAPTNFNFVAGDYNRKTGLVGDGSTKYLDSNRNNNADPRNSNHNAFYVSQAVTTGSALMGAGGFIAGANTILINLMRNRTSDSFVTGSFGVAGLDGHTRSQESGFTSRSSSVSVFRNVISEEPFNGNVFVFARNSSGPNGNCNARLAFYSIGESLDLALLDARVTDLITAIGAAF
jgi:hypothetical protein